MESQWQGALPDSLLLEIFYFLGISDLARASQVCQVWSRVSEDESVWHQLARNIWKVKGCLLPQRSSWKEEVKRLFYHVPILETNCIEKHTDEVLDVTISHNGKYFCTVSKDSSIIIWDLDDPIPSCINEVNTSKDLNWMLTQYSLFNGDDTLVLVCGVRNLTYEQERDEPNGCGAVYTVPDLRLVSLIYLEPFTLFGAWLDNRTFIAGLSDEESDCIHMRVYDCVNYLEPKKEEKVNITQHAENLLGHYAQHQTGLFSYEGSRLHQMNVITAKVPVGHADTIFKKDFTEKMGKQPKKNNVSVDILNENTEAGASESIGKEQQGDGSNSLHNTNAKSTDRTICDFVPKDVNDSDGAIINFITDNLSDIDAKICDYEFAKSFKNNDKSEIPVSVSEKIRTDQKKYNLSVDILDNPEAGASERFSKGPQEDSPDSLHNSNARVTGKTIRDFIPCDTNNSDGASIDVSTDNLSGMDTKICDHEFAKPFTRHDKSEVQANGLKTYVILVAGEHDVIQLFEVTDEHLADIKLQFAQRSYNSETSVVRPNHEFHIEQNYITGLCLSPDHRFVFFNHRAVCKKLIIDGHNEAYERIFSPELKIGMIDLVTMERVKDIEYKGHIGFSDYSPWYICLDVSQDFILSGSEDGRAYLWEKNYNTCLGVLNHKEGVVNGVAFSPVDQETCVTVCDDKLIKVWRSRHRRRQIEKNKLKKLNDYSMKLLSQSNQVL